MREFKSGDRIRIKSWDKMVEEYGYFTDEDNYEEDELIETGDCYVFSKDMLYLCGQIGYIIKLNEEEKCIEIELDAYGEITDWCITEEMIELI